MNLTVSTARITAIGSYVPEKKLTNADLEQMVDTSDEWIVQRTGMRERRIAGESEYSSTMAYKAVEDLVSRYGQDLTDVDCIIVSTTTPDYAFPSVACQIQGYFQIPSTAAFDLNATCAGFTYALHMANGLITSGLHRKVLVVAAETLSRVTDYTDRSTCILFGDGAAAVLVEKDEQRPSFIAAHLGTNGEGGIHGVETLLEQAGMTPGDVNWFVPHSANFRMVESICEKAGIPVEKTLTSMEYYGNTSSVSIPLALQLGLDEGKLQNGDTLLLYGFGGGLTHAGLILKWDVDDRG
ncbi:3-oxoacyl-[acyl-carrier-protein] synthase 3 protein 2 [Mortierella sp. GBA39]|nr:3-oxoacyl-[acyl-carrier-protein] synthase 3 protein 2 [Mortierella sp. GBA39]